MAMNTALGTASSLYQQRTATSQPSTPHWEVQRSVVDFNLGFSATRHLAVREAIMQPVLRNRPHLNHPNLFYIGSNVGTYIDGPISKLGWIMGGKIDGLIVVLKFKMDCCQSLHPELDRQLSGRTIWFAQIVSSPPYRWQSYLGGITLSPIRPNSN